MVAPLENVGKYFPSKQHCMNCLKWQGKVFLAWSNWGKVTYKKIYINKLQGQTNCEKGYKLMCYMF